MCAPMSSDARPHKTVVVQLDDIKCPESAINSKDIAKSHVAFAESSHIASFFQESYRRNRMKSDQYMSWKESLKKKEDPSLNFPRSGIQFKNRFRTRQFHFTLDQNLKEFNSKEPIRITLSPKRLRHALFRCHQCKHNAHILTIDLSRARIEGIVPCDFELQLYNGSPHGWFYEDNIRINGNRGGSIRKITVAVGKGVHEKEHLYVAQSSVGLRYFEYCFNMKKDLGLFIKQHASLPKSYLVEQPNDNNDAPNVVSLFAVENWQHVMGAGSANLVKALTFVDPVTKKKYFKFSRNTCNRIIKTIEKTVSEMSCVIDPNRPLTLQLEPLDQIKWEKYTQKQNANDYTCTEARDLCGRISINIVLTLNYVVC